MVGEVDIPTPPVIMICIPIVRLNYLPTSQFLDCR